MKAETSFSIVADDKTRGSHCKLNLRRFRLDITKKCINSTVPEGLPERCAVFVFLDLLKLSYTEPEFT